MVWRQARPANDFARVLPALQKVLDLTRQVAAAKAAKLAAQHGVRIYTVGIGTPEGTTLGFSGWSMRVRLDEQTLKNVAATTYGEYYAASSARQLKMIYERLSARMVVERGRTIEVTASVPSLIVSSIECE